MEQPFLGKVDHDYEIEQEGALNDDEKTKSHVAAPRRVFEVNTVFGEEQQNRRFRSNRVVTTKYNCFTFFPKNMF